MLFSCFPGGRGRARWHFPRPHSRMDAGASPTAPARPGRPCPAVIAAALAAIPGVASAINRRSSRAEASRASTRLPAGVNTATDGARPRRPRRKPAAQARRPWLAGRCRRSVLRAAGLGHRQSSRRRLRRRRSHRAMSRAAPSGRQRRRPGAWPASASGARSSRSAAPTDHNRLRRSGRSLLTD
jgi:hypothetical protein